MAPRRIFSLLAIAAVAVAAGYGLGQLVRGVEPPVMQAVTLLPVARVLPSASLDLGDDRAVATNFGDQAFDHRWTVVFIGFTNCPDVCPTTLALLARVTAQLPAGTRPRVLFLSVDPERDAQPKAAEFARWFAPDFLGATSANLGQLTQALGAPYSRVANGDGYSYDHSAALFLLDPQGRFAAVATPPHDAAGLAADLAALAGLP